MARRGVTTALLALALLACAAGAAHASLSDQALDALAMADELAPVGGPRMLAESVMAQGAPGAGAAPGQYGAIEATQTVVAAAPNGAVEQTTTTVEEVVVTAAPAPAGACAAGQKLATFAVSATKLCVVSAPDATTGTLWHGMEGKLTVSTTTPCTVASSCAATAVEAAPSASASAAPTNTFTLGFPGLNFGRKLRAAGAVRALQATQAAQEVQFFYPSSAPTAPAGEPATKYYSAPCYAVCS